MIVGAVYNKVKDENNILGFDSIEFVERRMKETIVKRKKGLQSTTHKYEWIIKITHNSYSDYLVINEDNDEIIETIQCYDCYQLEN